MVLALPEDMLSRESDAADAAPLPRRAIRPRRPPTGGATGSARARRAAVRDPRRRRLDTPGNASGMTAFLEANELPAGAAFRRQDVARQRLAVLRRRRRDRHQPGARRPRAARPTCCSWSGPRLGEMTTSGYTLLEPSAPDADARARASGRRGARSGLPGGAADPRRARRSSPRPSRTCASSRAGGAGRAGRAGRLRGLAAAGPMPGALDLGECVAHLRERVPDAIVMQRRRQLHRLGAPLLALPLLPEPARADERRDGLRAPGGRRSEGARPRSGR